MCADTVFEVTELDKAYAAGLMDADGSFTLVKSKVKSTSKFYYGARCIVESTDIEIEHWFESLWGGSTFCCKSVDKLIAEGKNWRPKWRWTVASKSAEKFLDDVYPYLKLKKPRARLLRLNRQFMGRHALNLGINETVPDAMCDLHEEIAQRVRTLNQRGQDGW